MPTYDVSGPGGTRRIIAPTEQEARHLAMVERWGDISDSIVPRSRLPNGQLAPYAGYGLTLVQVKP